MPDDLSRVLVGRIKELLEAKGWNYRRFAEETGIASPHISVLMRGNQSVSFSRIEVIAKALGVDASELFESLSVKLPYRGVVGAGPGRNEPGELEMIEVPSKFKLGDGVYLVAGDSMKLAGIPDGSRIVVRKNPSPEPGDTVVAWDDDKGMLVKRFGGPPPQLLSFDGITPPCTDLRSLTMYGVYLGVLDSPAPHEPKPKKGRK